MKTMKNLLIATSMVLALASCKKGDEPKPAPSERKFCIETPNSRMPQYIIQFGNTYTKDNGDTIVDKTNLYVYPYLIQYNGVNYKPCNDNNNLVTLCHTNNDGTHTTLTVPSDSVKMHLQHGDNLGVCSPF